MAARDGKPDSGDDENDAQQVDDPVRSVEEGEATGDEYRPEHDGAEDPPEQEPMLVRGGNREGRKDHREDEDVVD